MPDWVEIRKDGIYGYKFTDGKEVSSKIEESNIFHVLKCNCQLEEKITLKDVFNVVDSLPNLKNFLSQYSNCPIDLFHADAALPYEHVEDDLEYLEIYCAIDNVSCKDYPYFDKWTGFHGIGNGTMFCISYSPMNTIANYELKLNQNVEIYEKHDEKPIVSSLCHFTLLEVLDAIYDDISFHGGPDENKKFLEKLAETSRKIKSGEEKTYPLLFNEDGTIKEFEDEEN